MKYAYISLSILLTCSILSACQKNSKDKGTEESIIKVIRTTSDQSLLLAEDEITFSQDIDTSKSVISINPKETYQEMDGFGFTLTGGSALHLSKMDKENRAELLEELFNPKVGIGISYLRVSIGSSDLDEKVFSYHDIENGENDINLEKFDLGYDKEYLIPVLKEILAITPDIKIMGSPWSPPKWMKDNKDSRGGSLMPQYYDVYAQYFVKYIKEMAKEGIEMDAITVQNEPLHPGNNPSLLMKAKEQAEFVKEHLGPAFTAENLETKIIIYDHNADRPDYPISILDDKEARKYIDGSAFHLYGGKIEALSEVHEKHPDKNLYFTEQWVGAPGDFPDNLTWHTRELIIGASRNWCKTVLEWNLAADENEDPHTDRGGCDRCLGAVTISGNGVIRNPAYYIIGQASKHVRPGSIRLASSLPDKLPNVAFQNPEGNIVLIVLNDGKVKNNFAIEVEDRFIKDEIQPGSVSTYVIRT